MKAGSEPQTGSVRRLVDVPPVPAAGAPLSLRVVGVRVLPGPDGVDRCVVSVAAPEAPPGDYALRLVLRDPDTGQSARAETAFHLRR